ncbi:MAG TPA: hypothetical protein VK095_00270 [Beutenbergiaceae bacterium]|nr:hypothetical protein [Beutenbergiaceae bacterium]
MAEEPLTGGNSTTVVRIGDGVHRRAGHADARAGSTGRADLAEHARMYRQDREHIAALI